MQTRQDEKEALSEATLANLLCESRLFAVALLTELITPSSGKSEKVKRKLEEAETFLCTDSEHK